MAARRRDLHQLLEVESAETRSMLLLKMSMGFGQWQMSQLLHLQRGSSSLMATVMAVQIDLHLWLEPMLAHQMDSVLQFLLAESLPFGRRGLITESWRSSCATPNVIIKL